jgi:DNA invertase Pin-like site-specific DNA recombinase
MARNRTTPATTRAVAYLRVSTAHQADHGASLDAQRAKVEAYAALYDLDLVQVVVDAGASAKSLQRDGLQRALGMLDNGDADALLVVKLDRLTRSVRDLDTLITRYFGASDGPALLSVGEQIDTRSAAGRLVLNVLASVSQWEREAIGERTRTALAHKRAQGQRVGQVPFGYALADDGVQLVADQDEQDVLVRVQGLRAQGVSIRGIAQRLNDDGTPARGKRWHATTVSRLLARD